MMPPSDNKPSTVNNQFEQPKPTKSTGHAKRNDIQGLRAFAILSVYVYHLKTNWLPLGYLGVDMFFVISGFLMAMLLSAKGRPNLTISFDFYYRRWRRIMPTYLLVIILTLLLATCYVQPMDREELINEARGALRLYANVQPLFEKVTYFQMLASYRFFAHSWSLCVEMQFYLVVPLLFLFLHPLTWTGRFRLCALVAMISFFGQLVAPPLYVHGFTPLRLWQFMIGILVYYWTGEQERRRREVGKGTVISAVFQNGSETFPDDLVHSSSDILKQNEAHLNVLLCLIGSLLLMLMKESWIGVWLARFMCTAMSGFILWSGAKYPSPLMTNCVSQWIGDHSYTIYLVHWPIIVYWRYLFGQQLGLYDFLSITIITLLFTFVIDLLMDSLMLKFTNRTSSLVFILILYLACEPLLGYLSSTAKSKKELSMADELDVRHMLKNYYAGQPPNLTDQEALEMNGLLYSYAMQFKGCRHPTGLNASHLNMTRREMFVCKEEGFGHRNALIVGNSLARHAFVGIAHHFRPHYARLQLHAVENCSPFLESTEGKEDEADCRRYVQSLELAFKEFGPDVIFIVYRFPESEQPFQDHNDQLLRGMQWLYSLANKYAREMVFVPAVEVRFRVFQPMDAILDALRVGQSLGKLRMSRMLYYYHRNRPSHWLRVRNAHCPKCTIVDWSDAISHRDACYSVDMRSKLSYFMDRLHVTDVGSFYYGKLLLELFERRKAVKEVEVQ